MATIADLLGLNQSRKPRWETVTAWELRTGDLVRISDQPGDMAVIHRVIGNATTGAVEVVFSHTVLDLQADTLCKVKRQR